MTNQHRFATRRDFLGGVTAWSSVAAFGTPLIAAASQKATPDENIFELAPRAQDWEWAVGQWDVRHERLKGRLVNSIEWETFNGQSTVWLTLDGLGAVEDNVLELPGGAYRALGIRAFNPTTGQWAIWWLDGRNPTGIESPVYGHFETDSASFFGRDNLDGRPIQVRFRWLDIHGAQPRWEQAFSPDDGATWEANWRMTFSRPSFDRQPPPSADDPTLAPTRDDWAFLKGVWDVRHDRLEKPLVDDDNWVTFDGTLDNRSVMGGAGNVSDNVINLPSGPIRGLDIRVFDPAAKQWMSWWLDGRDPVIKGTPIRGSFVDGIGTFSGEDSHEGRAIVVRVQWSRITARTAQCEQAFSTDGGKAWKVNWISRFTRKG
jgi:hypothetical protein